MMTDLLAAVADPHSPDGGLDLAIEVGDSIMSHRQRYGVFTSRESVIDLLALDETNPRSVRFHLDVIRKRVDDLAGLRPLDQMWNFAAQVSALRADITAQSVNSLDTKAISRLHADILTLSTGLHATFMQ